MHTRFRWVNLRERDQLEDLGIDVSIILKWIFKNWDESVSGYGQVAGSSICRNEHDT